MATMGFIQQSDTPRKIETSILVPETFTHAIAFGQTGSGKTTGFIYPNLLKRLEAGHGILLYDYKGKEHMSVKHLAQEVSRLEDVVEIGKPWGAYINLVEKMDEEELDHFFDRVLGHSDEHQYWHNSAKSLGQSIFKVLKGIEVFTEAYNVLEFECIEEGIDVGPCVYPTKRNLSALIKVCSTYASLSNFVKHLKSLNNWAEEKVEEGVVDFLERHGCDVSLVREDVSELLYAQKTLKTCIEESRDALESFGQDANENLTQNIIGSLVGPLLTLSQNQFFNTDAFDIVKALNEGKIIVVNTEALSNEVLESVNSMLMYELSQRTRQNNLNPVSIFIDEAQRVLSESTDLPIDVLREAKVDVIMATQNRALLINKLSKEKFDALMGNMTRQYFFQNQVDEEVPSEGALNRLESFEYYSSEDALVASHSSRPLFISNDEKLSVELRYQKFKRVLHDFAHSHLRKKVIIEYVPRLYRAKKLMMISLKDLREKEIRVENPQLKREHEKALTELLDEAESHLFYLEEEALDEADIWYHDSAYEDDEQEYEFAS